MLKHIFLNVFCFLLIQGIAEAGQEVIAVQAHNVKPYSDALKGFKSVCNCDIKSLFISEMKEKDLLKTIRSSNADLVLAIGNEALRRVKDVEGVPILYMMVLNPQLIIPDKENVTGVGMNVSPETQLSILQQALPGMKRVGILYDPAKTGHFVKKAKAAAAERGMTLIAKEVHSPKDFPGLLRNMKGEIDAFWMLPDVTAVTPETTEFLLLFSIENRVPVLTFSDKYLEMGALMSVEIDPVNVGRQAGEMALKMLSGAAARDLREMDAPKAVISINLTAAGKLGVSFRDEIIGRSRIFNGKSR